ncbi:MAG TPA: DUF4153 domain-containing protein [Fodinibius sp.]|nr:DUF4153 domain-containing protein [Fodinibius sp.]
MRLPSLDHIAKKSFSALRRFPFALASATLAALITVYLIALPYQRMEEVHFLYSAILVLVLGIPLFIALSLVREQRQWNRTTATVVSAAAAVTLLIYYFLLPGDLDKAPSEHVLRYILYFIALHLLVAVAPFGGKGKMNGFWQYNKTLFLRLLTAVLFSGVLFIGLAVALGSIDVLFRVDIEGEFYLQLFVLIAGIFNTWFFLSGIPQPLQQLESVETYPKGLKVFTQHILIPLVTVYMVILYLYTVKIILEWTWPEGSVAYLVLSFSTVGIFALLLLHPIRESVENRWIKRFSRGYFRALIPLVILLLLAIWVRIDEYGITVNRYFVLILGLWLAGIVCYLILTKTENIKLIPASLGVMAVLISFGPWGAFSVAEQSQVKRLQQYLQENNILQDGAIQQISGPLSFEDRSEISSIIRYLNNTHGLENIQPWFEQDLNNLSAGENNSTRMLPPHERPSKIAELMGIEYTLRRPADNIASSWYFSSQPRRSLSIEEFDWIIRDIRLQPTKASDTLQAGDQTLIVRIAPDSLNLLLSPDGQQDMTVKLAVDTLAMKLLQDSRTTNLSSERMAITASGDRLQAKAYFYSLSLGGETGEFYLENAQLDLLVKVNRENE